ncbi:MAG: hypothetical protein DYG89_10480 [Caldilinea sp. CFX5]|nr:hypothetical protein [Caldilinea sp. CFX5]
MATGPTSPRNTGSIMRDLQRIWQLLRDPSVPGWKWLLPIGAILYWIWPVDLMPVLPFDDIAVVILAISMLLQMAARNEQATAGQQSQSGATANNQEKVVDTTWRVVDK